MYITMQEKHFIVRCTDIDMHDYARRHNLSPYQVFFSSTVENAQRDIVHNEQLGSNFKLFLHLPTKDCERIYQSCNDGYRLIFSTDLRDFIPKFEYPSCALNY